MRVSSTYTNYFTGYDLVNKKVFSYDLKTVRSPIDESQLGDCSR